MEEIFFLTKHWGAWTPWHWLFCLFLNAILVRNEIIEALELVKEGCTQTLLSCSFLCSTQNFYLQERNILCTFFLFWFLETVDLGATTLFKKISRNKDVKNSNCSLDFCNTSWIFFKVCFIFNSFLNIFTVQRWCFVFVCFKNKNKTVTVSVDTGLLQSALWGKYHSLDTRGQYVCFLATVVLQRWGVFCFETWGCNLFKIIYKSNVPKLVRKKIQAACSSLLGPDEVLVNGTMM